MPCLCIIAYGNFPIVYEILCYSLPLCVYNKSLCFVVRQCNFCTHHPLSTPPPHPPLLYQHCCRPTLLGVRFLTPKDDCTSQHTIKWHNGKFETMWGSSEKKKKEGLVDCCEFQLIFQIFHRIFIDCSQHSSMLFDCLNLGECFALTLFNFLDHMDGCWIFLERLLLLA